MGRGANQVELSSASSAPRRNSSAETLSGSKLIAVVPPAEIDADSAATWAQMSWGNYRSIAADRHFTDCVPETDGGYWTDDDEWVSVPLETLYRELDRGIAQHRLPAPTVVYQGASGYDLVSLIEMTGSELMPWELLGREITETDYLRTAADRSAAALQGQRATLELRVSAGTPVLSMPALGFAERGEFLFPRGCTITFRSVRQRPSRGMSGSTEWEIAADVDGPWPSAAAALS
jgi:hypothetical protein